MYQVNLMIPRMPSTIDLLPYLNQIDSTKVYSNFGILHAELIRRLANHFGVSEENIALCSNATLAIAGAVYTSSHVENTWECPSWTFTASPAALLGAHRKIRFGDVDKSGRLRIPEDCANLLDVLPFGDEPIAARYQKSKMSIVIDAAASFDALSKPGAITGTNTAYIVSMHATKLVGAGEGGIFISLDKQWVSKFKSWTNFGMNGSGDRNSYQIGTNAKISEYACAVALASIDLWNDTKKRILKNTQIAINLSQKYNLTPIASMLKGFATPYWIVQLDNAREKELLKAQFLLDGIQFREWWGHGCHLMPAYQKYSRGEFPTTSEIAQTSLGLPFHYFLSDDDWILIEHALMNFRG